MATLYRMRGFGGRLIAPIVAQTVRYVATTGNDTTGDGSIGNPWLTLSKGLSMLSPNWLLYMRGGTYGGTLNTADSQTYTVPSGTSWANAITVAAYPTETVIIQPSSGVPCVRLTTGAPSYLIFQDLVFDMINSAALQTASPYCVFGSSGAHHNRFLRCTLKNSASFGGGFSEQNADSPYNEFVGCNVMNTGYAADADTNGHGLYLTVSNFLIDGCLIHDNTGYGVHCYNTVQGNPAFGVIRNNRIYTNGTNHGTAYGCVINRGDGNAFYNNLVYGNRQGLLVYTDSDATHNYYIYSNTFYNNTLDAATLQFNSGTTFYKNNIAYANGTNVLVENACPVSKSNNLEGTDPSFISPATSDFRIPAGSAARDIGATLGSPYNSDFAGVTRPQGVAYDAGAHEYF